MLDLIVLGAFNAPTTRNKKVKLIQVETVTLANGSKVDVIRDIDGVRKLLDGQPAMSEKHTTPPRFYWKQCYEIGGRAHWALCDTETDAEGEPHRVSCLEMILRDYWSPSLDSQPLPKLIVELLNAHYTGSTELMKARNIGDALAAALMGEYSRADALGQWAADLKLPENQALVDRLIAEGIPVEKWRQVERKMEGMR